MTAPIHIDGSQGEGGGQVVRSAVALSLITGKSVRLTNIRARRSRPGLQRQHLVAVRAAACLGEGRLEGDRLGASSLTFYPPPLDDRRQEAGRSPGGSSGGASGGSSQAEHDRRQLHFRIGTAGSTSLVAQTLIPALLARHEPVTVRLGGGTHNMLAPPYDYLAQVYLPVLHRMGFPLHSQLNRHGFYPAGGGEIQLTIDSPDRLRPLCLLDRGDRRRIRIRALVANLPQHIAERECQTAGDLTQWDDAEYSVEVLKNVSGPGNVLLIELHFQHVTEIFCGFGQRGVRAEEVAKRAVEEAQQYLAADAPVGKYLADQIMLPCALIAGEVGESTFRTTALTDHFHTHADVIRRFLPVAVTSETLDDGSFIVRIR